MYFHFDFENTSVSLKYFHFITAIYIRSYTNNVQMLPHTTPYYGTLPHTTPVPCSTVLAPHHAVLRHCPHHLVPCGTELRHAKLNQPWGKAGTKAMDGEGVGVCPAIRVEDRPGRGRSLVAARVRRLACKFVTVDAALPFILQAIAGYAMEWVYACVLGEEVSLGEKEGWSRASHSLMETGN